MSNRSLVEINHDHCIAFDNEVALLRFARGIMAYLRAADPKELPDGVTFKAIRHHSDPCPLAVLQDASVGAPHWRERARAATQAMTP